MVFVFLTRAPRLIHLGNPLAICGPVPFTANWARRRSDIQGPREEGGGDFTQKSTTPLFREN